MPVITANAAITALSSSFLNYMTVEGAYSISLHMMTVTAVESSPVSLRLSKASLAQGFTLPYTPSCLAKLTSHLTIGRADRGASTRIHERILESVQCNSSCNKRGVVIRKFPESVYPCKVCIYGS